MFHAMRKKQLNVLEYGLGQAYIDNVIDEIWNRIQLKIKRDGQHIKY